LNTESQTDLDRCPIADSREFGESVPVIDIAGITQNASGEAAHQAVDEIAKACREWGFFQVINHGISDELIDQESAGQEGSLRFHHGRYGPDLRGRKPMAGCRDEIL
jgi:hypothetical protein